jgi:hypothetical protein
MSSDQFMEIWSKASDILSGNSNSLERSQRVIKETGQTDEELSVCLKLVYAFRLHDAVLARNFLERRGLHVSQSRADKEDIDKAERLANECLGFFEKGNSEAGKCYCYELLAYIYGSGNDKSKKDIGLRYAKTAIDFKESQGISTYDLQLSAVMCQIGLATPDNLSEARQRLLRVIELATAEENENYRSAAEQMLKRFDTVVRSDGKPKTTASGCGGSAVLMLALLFLAAVLSLIQHGI